MLNGVLAVDKPSGMTSHDVVAKLRRVLSQKRIGHAGTLDPLATGLLVVLLGNATRASDHAAAKDKEYIATLRLGVKTDTQDITGRVLFEKEPVCSESLKNILPRFCGKIMQKPPMYSAVSVGGVRLYELARRGEEIQRAEREIEIKRTELLKKLSDREYELKIECSKGTYIRTLLNDIGDALSCGGCMSALRRTRSGGLSVENALTLSRVEELFLSGGLSSHIIPTDSLYAEYPAAYLNEYGEKRTENGAFVDETALLSPLPEGGFCRLYSRKGEFWALAKTGELSRGGRAAFPVKSFKTQD